MIKKNLKNLTATYCPFCFNKLKIERSDVYIPYSSAFSIKNNYYKQDIKKVDKASDILFSRNLKKTVDFVNMFNFKPKYFNRIRLKLNNKMTENSFNESQPKQITYSMWSCINKSCDYYRIIDEIEYDYSIR